MKSTRLARLVALTVVALLLTPALAWSDTVYRLVLR